MAVRNSRAGIVVVNRNGGELLDRCLSHLSRQTFPPACIIVVDNASSDGSADIIDDKYSSVKVIRVGRNSGFAEGSNIGAQFVKDCEWVALVNPDAFVAIDWLERLIDSTRRFPEFAVFGSRLVQSKELTRLDGVGDVYHVSGVHWRRGHGEVAEGSFMLPEEIFSPCAAAALYRRDAFFESQGFDKSFFCYAEDVDLGFRLRLAGHRCLYVPDAVVHHVGSAITGHRSDFTVYHGHRNLVWAYVKNMPSLLLWLYLPQHIFLNLVSIVWFSLQGRMGVILKAKWDAILGLPHILRERRRVQSTRRVGAREIRQVMVKGWLTPYVKRLRRHA